MATYKELFDSQAKCGDFPNANGSKTGCGANDFTLKQYPMMMNLRDRKEFIAECKVCGNEMSIEMAPHKGIIRPKSIYQGKPS